MFSACRKENTLFSPNSSISTTVCRICQCKECCTPNDDIGPGEPLISPCFCKGTIGYFHRSCLERWIGVSRKIRCEICGFMFLVKRRRRTFYQFLKTKDAVDIRRKMILNIAFIICLISFPFIVILRDVHIPSGGVPSDLNGSALFVILFFYLIVYFCYPLWLDSFLRIASAEYAEWRKITEVELICENSACGAINKRTRSACDIRLNMPGLSPAMESTNMSSSGQSEHEATESANNEPQQPDVGDSPEVISIGRNDKTDTASSHLPLANDKNCSLGRMGTVDLFAPDSVAVPMESDGLLEAAAYGTRSSTACSSCSGIADSILPPVYILNR